MGTEPMPTGRVRYGVWALRVITWDAVLPVFVTFLPLGVRLLFPNRRGALELTAVMLPVAAFFLRFRAGKRHINANRCSHRLRRFQLFVFCVGILPLVLIDCVIILSELMPAGAFGAADYIALGIMISIYLASMIIAMYPGREDVLPDDLGHPYVFADDRTEDDDIAHSIP
jgi:hypothetical protein